MCMTSSYKLNNYTTGLDRLVSAAQTTNILLMVVTFVSVCSNYTLSDW